MKSGQDYRDFRVPPKRWSDIETIAEDLRARLGISRVEHLKIVPLVEKVLSGRLGLFDFYVHAPEEIMKRFGVSLAAAKNRLETVRKENA